MLVMVTANFLLHSARTWSLFVLLQAHQQLPESLLSATTRTALGAFTSQIDQLGYPLPAGASRNGVLAVGQEVVRILSGRGHVLVLFRVVVVVELVDRRLRILDSPLLLARGRLFSVCDLLVAVGAP
jgi:hypothetical protein